MPSHALGELNAIDTSRVGPAVRPRLRPRGLPPALEPHPVYETDDPLEAAVLARPVLGPCRIRVSAADLTAFRAGFHAVHVRDVLLGHLEYATEAVVEARSTPDDFLVVVPASGHATVRTQGEVVEATPVTSVVIHPGSSVVIHGYDQTAHVLIRLPRAVVERHLVRLLGRSLDQPLAFAPRFELARAEASRWNFAVQILHAELLDPASLLSNGVGVGQLEEFTMSALLYSQQSTYSAALRVEPSAAGNRAVRAACEYIEANLAVELTLPDIAAHAGVGVRALQLGFRSQLSTTPMSFVRDRRLERVRDELADASPASEVTVSAVALRWGFTHLGRFSAEYRSRFGETPSHTLRR